MVYERRQKQAKGKEGNTIKELKIWSRQFEERGKRVTEWIAVKKGMGGRHWRLVSGKLHERGAGT